MTYSPIVSSRAAGTTNSPPAGTVVSPEAGFSQPISVILSSQGEDRITPGETLEVSVTVSNKGNQSAVIDVFLDDLPETLYSWCSNTQTRLALEPGQGDEVVFEFKVPLTAISGGYRYWLVVDAPNHYPDRPRQRYEQNIQVLPPSHTAVKVNDPTFAIAPLTTSKKPAKVLPGTPVQFQVHVYNRTDRVDRFRLQCKDLPESWISISYPQGFQMPGLAAEANCLNLNPGASGVVSLAVTPPMGELAKIYLATLQLKAENDPSLKLYEILYLDVQPTYQVETRFRTLVSRIHQQSGLFSIQASNKGNTPRILDFKILGLQDSDLCDYAIEPASLTLAPHQTLTSQIAVRPRQPWRRPLFGAGRVIQFEVVATDREEKPIPEIPMPGMLVWAARPWWQILPVVLVLLGSAVGLVWLIWWYLLRPPVPAEILQFAAEDTVYEANSGDAVHVGFEIAQPDQVQQIEIVGQSAEGDLLSGPLTFNLAQGLPEQLEERCQTQKQRLTCRNVRTDARREGEYTFTLTLIPQPGQKARPVQAIALPVSVVPEQPPSIVEVVPTALVYTEARVGAETAGMPRLDWIIDWPQQIETLELVGRDEQGNAAAPAIVYDFSAGELPEELLDFCVLDKQLVCKNVPTGIQRSGTYAFDLTAIPSEGAIAQSVTVTSEQVRIQSRSPKLLSFTLNGEPAQPNYLIPIEPGSKPINLTLAWEVEDAPGTQVMLTPSPGTVPAKGTLPIWLSPTASETMVSLQITGAAGESITRSINITTYDPTPEVPTIVVNTGDAVPAQAEEESSGSSSGNAAGGRNSRGTVAPERPGLVSPVELPPQFE